MYIYIYLRHSSQATYLTDCVFVLLYFILWLFGVLFVCLGQEIPLAPLKHLIALSIHLTRIFT